jgi:hypothetical protein
MMLMHKVNFTVAFRCDSITPKGATDSVSFFCPLKNLNDEAAEMFFHNIQCIMAT